MSEDLDAKRKDRLREEWEAMCDPRKGCRTVCCHYEGEPCENLRWTDRRKGVGVCSIYPTRFGLRRTAAGTLFQCAPMRDWLLHRVPPKECGYYGIPTIEGAETAYGREVLPMVRGMR